MIHPINRVSDLGKSKPIKSLLHLAQLSSHFIPNGFALPILKGPLRGFNWVTGAAAGEAKGMSPLFHLAETEQINTAKRLLSPTDICYDIGANVGLYSLLFSRYTRKVYAFEPSIRNISFLHGHVERNGLVNVIVLPWALSSNTSTVFFNPGRNNATGKIDQRGKHPVMAWSLDDLIEQKVIEPATILKIDVEGEEYKVLLGGRLFLKRCSPAILLSTHGELVKRKCVNLLADELGYSSFLPIDNSRFDMASEFLIRK